MPRKKQVKLVEMPFIPLRGLMVFPQMVLHFDVGRQRSVSSLEKAMTEDQQIFLVAQMSAEMEEMKRENLYEVGTIAMVKQVLNLPGDAIRVMVEGKQRGRLVSITEDDKSYLAQVELHEDAVPDTDEFEALVRTAEDLFDEYVSTSQHVSEETARTIKETKDPGEMVDLMAANVLTKLEERQLILSEMDVSARVETMCRFLMRETEMSRLEKQVQVRLKKLVDKNQKEYYLREQIHAIQEELGDRDGSDTDELRKKLLILPMNEEAREKGLKELDRVSHMAPGTPEINVSRTYVEWITDLPWGKYTEDNLNLSAARKVLAEDHYAMEKVKERIIEHLAVRRIKEERDGKGSMKGPILCFVGPPGVGKTSIVKSIARAMGRKFVQMSLGGVRDEAEIRGHRRTYVGAIPGRIIAGIKQAGTMNPVFLFDEIDKMSHDFRGDPASAMLEVLDGEQNGSFRDHYLELPFDLSQVLFITTANTMEEIPTPLLDRMEVIEVPSYTEEEKLQIGKLHLLPKQLKEHGLPPKSVRVTDTIMKRIIEDYTREAGVRTLDRVLAKVVRKAAVEMLDEYKTYISVGIATLRKYLGAPRYLRDLPEKEPLVGVVNGLAYTTVGGETLEVECSVMPGTGQVQLTGQLGDVMKESAQAARSWVRAHADAYGIDAEFYKNLDIHVHVPEGAVPKDGPSAGVALATAMVSALSGRKVRQDVAMTGEITLRGRVLPIGGVKEKLMAAYRAGIKHILLPTENEKDLEELPRHILESFEIVYPKTIEDVLQHALVQ